MIHHQEIARILYRNLLRLHRSTEHTEASARLPLLFKLASQLFLFATQEEKLKFADLSTRIAFVGHKYGIPGKQLFWVYEFRKHYLLLMSGKKAAWNDAELYELGLLAVAGACQSIFQEAIPGSLRDALPDPDRFRRRETKIRAFRPFARVLLTQHDEDKCQFAAIDEEQPGGAVRIQYNITGRNDFFNPSVALARKVFGLPLSVNLLDVEIDAEGVYRPGGFVILPDYLVDVTSISECFTANYTAPMLYLLKKFIPKRPNVHLAIGNAANYFLDELLSGSKAGFQSLFKDIFTHSPIGFSTMTDQEIRQIHQHAKCHYRHLVHSIQTDFKAQGIDEKNSYIEPSFYSRNYGLQGRLDLFHHQPDGKAAIVELKSGRPFMPNKQGMSINHYIQTLLYDLLVKSVYGKKINPTNFILYSQVENNRLRFAQVSKSHQMEAMQVRNHLVAIEFLMTRLNAERHTPLHKLSAAGCPHWKGFNAKDLAFFEEHYQALSGLEKKYFHTICGFIAREHFTAKIGSSKAGDISGQANLWAKSTLEKNKDFEILSQLYLQLFENEGDTPIITFHETEATNPLANFRVGDICVLYPSSGMDASVLQHQIFKCNIIHISPGKIQVRLRAKQHNTSIFDHNPLWNIEHDLYDSSFNNQYRELLAFAGAEKEKRDLFLGIRAPGKGTEQPTPCPGNMTENQKSIFKKIVNQGDLFLLWGPPGTGKTNMMLKNLVGYSMDNSAENILLLTYTNRAADEICSAIESYHPDIREKYYRIGSRFSTSEKYKGRLLDHLIKDCQKRQEVKEVIQSHRIVIATVASMMGRKDLFRLKQFDRLIIDEASQITESMLCGIMPTFPKVLMIGDHKQLPAVTTQHTGDCLVRDEELRSIGFSDLRCSLFERLYLWYKKNNYHHAIGQLKEQGRMHQDIMYFPSRHFYQNTLSILPDDIPYSRIQKAPLEWQGGVLAKKRLVFFPVRQEEAQLFDKTNRAEAEKIVELALRFRQLYANNNVEFSFSDIGVITPFRAQIACIRERFQAAGIPPDQLTIDTVERYQGGARDIILISVCANSPIQLDGIVSKQGDDPVDRKLNVALTRARKHLCIVGNPDVLKYDENYALLMENADFCTEGNSISSKMPNP